MKEILSIIIVLAALAFCEWVAYRKGRADERYAQKYCSDCADELEQDGLCCDCRHKLYGEMKRD